MNYITNKDHISTSALYDPNYLSHGLSWGSHRYIKREGTPGHYTYTYPEDLRNAGQQLVTGAKNLVTSAGNAVQNASQTVSGAARNAGQAVGRAVGFTQRKEMQKAQAQHRVAEARLNRSMQEYDGSEGANRRFSVAARQESRADENAMNTRIAYSKTPLGRAEQATRDAREFIKSIPDEIKYQVEVGIPYDVDHFINSTVGIQKRRELLKARDAYNQALDAYKEAAGLDSNGRRNTYLIPTNLEEYAIVNRLNSASDSYIAASRAYGKSWLGSMEKLLNTNLYKHHGWY